MPFEIRSSARRAMFLVVLLGLASGCSEKPDIVRQKVRKPPAAADQDDIQSLATQEPPLPAMPASSSKSDRMLAAIVPVGKQGWFFKVTGSIGGVGGQRDSFVQLLQTLDLSGPKPRWVTPPGWSETPGSGMRAATFNMAADGESLECSVIPLPSDDPTTDQYLLDNINRWRGQVGLEPLALAALQAGLKDETNQELNTLKTQDGVSITWVDLQNPQAGKAAGSSLVGPAGPAGPLPSPGSARNPAGPSTTASDTDAGNSPATLEEMTFEVPEGWARGRVNSFRRIAWEVADGDNKVEIFISTLAAAGSDIASNVNRWRQQVGLESLSGVELDESIEAMQISGIDGHFVNLPGEKQTIAGAIVVHGDVGWFFKLQGESKLAAQQIDRFRAFLSSVKFR